jgi:hypothetical protein
MVCAYAPRSRIAHVTSRKLDFHNVTRKKDDGFASCALMALAAALADFNYKDAEIIVAAMAKEYGVGTYARRAREVLHQGHDLLH